MTRKLHILRHTKLAPDMPVKAGEVYDIGDDDDAVPERVAHSAIAFGNAREVTEEEADKLKAEQEGKLTNRDPTAATRDPKAPPRK